MSILRSKRDIEALTVGQSKQVGRMLLLAHHKRARMQSKLYSDHMFQHYHYRGRRIKETKASLVS